MFAIDLGKVLTVAGKIIQAADARVPVNSLTEEIAKAKIAGFDSLDPTDRETIVRGVVLASSEYDIRAGRSGGAGRREWFKGGASASEPTGAAAKIAKRLREEHGLEKPDAIRVANLYLECLAEGDLEGPLSDQAMIKRFK